MRDQLRLGSPLCWAVAWALAIAAPALYVAGLGWFTVVLALPLVGLALWREERRDTRNDSSPLGEGPYSPPPGL
jgi:hypothetical protein